VEIGCSLKEGPSISHLRAVTFHWRVTNARYVLIKGYDKARHPLIGEFDRDLGGAFTFIAVNGDEIVRKACMCVPKYDPNMGENLDDIEQDEKVFSSRSEGSNFKLTTALSRSQLKDLLIHLVHANYGVVLETQYASAENIFLVTKSYGRSEFLCKLDGCKNDGSQLIRQLGFDILAQRNSQEGRKTSYAFHVTAEVLSKPASENGEWEFDSNSKEIAALMSKKLIEDIISSGQQTGSLVEREVAKFIRVIPAVQKHEVQ
jgi:hypothetical protein